MPRSVERPNASRYAEAGCLEVRPTVTPLGSHADGIEDTPLAAKANDAREAWAERMPRDVADLWGFIVGLDDGKRLALLGHCASRTVVMMSSDEVPMLMP